MSSNIDPLSGFPRRYKIKKENNNIKNGIKLFQSIMKGEESNIREKRLNKYGNNNVRVNPINTEMDVYARTPSIEELY